MSCSGEPVVGPLGMPAPEGGKRAEPGPPVAVVGFGRCGSTMVMRMLRAGGIPFSEGAHSYSGEQTEGDIAQAIAAVRPGTVTKLLDPNHPECRFPPEADSWVFLWLDRDPIQQSRSWAKVCVLFGLDRPTPLKQYEVRKQWAIDRETALNEKLPGRVHTFRYEDFVNDPAATAQALADALPEYNLDVAAMAAVVHGRKAECRPDLTAEDAATFLG